MSESAHDKILFTARHLFFKYGINKVTIEEICKDAGVSKMTFYRLFKNKNELAEKVIEGIIEKGVKDYLEIMESNTPFPEKLNGLLELKYREIRNISEAFIKDLYSKNEAFFKKLKEAQLMQAERVRRDFSQAQKEGWINPELSMDFILFMLNDLNEKMKDESLRMMYTHPSKLIMDLTQFFFNGISSPKGKE